MLNSTDTVLSPKLINNTTIHHHPKGMCALSWSIARPHRRYLTANWYWCSTEVKKGQTSMSDIYFNFVWHHSSSSFSNTFLLLLFNAFYAGRVSITWERCVSNHISPPPRHNRRIYTLLWWHWFVCWLVYVPTEVLHGDTIIYPLDFMKMIDSNDTVSNM